MHLNDYDVLMSAQLDSKASVTRIFKLNKHLRFIHNLYNKRGQIISNSDKAFINLQFSKKKVINKNAKLSYA